MTPDQIATRMVSAVTSQRHNDPWPPARRLQMNTAAEIAGILRIGLDALAPAEGKLREIERAMKRVEESQKSAAHAEMIRENERSREMQKMAGNAARYPVISRA